MPSVRNTPHYPFSAPLNITLRDRLSSLGASPTTPESPLSVSSPVSEAYSEFSNDESFVPSPSHARKRKNGHVPRPPNAFMIFRSEMWRAGKLNPSTRDHRNVSTIAGMCWNSLSPEQQRPYKEMAERVKQKHMFDNPGYKYSPTSRKQQSSPKKRVHNDELNKQECWKVANLMIQGYEGTALENAIKSGLGDTDRIPALPTPDASSASSSPRTRRRNTRAQSSTADRARKAFPAQERAFVPSSDIAHIEQSMSAIKFPIYPTPGDSPELLPPRTMPSWVDTHMGIKPQAVEFVHNYNLAMNQNLDHHEFFASGPTTNCATADMMPTTALGYLSNSAFGSMYQNDGISFADGALTSPFTNMLSATGMGDTYAHLGTQEPNAYAIDGISDVLDPVIYGEWRRSA